MFNFECLDILCAEIGDPSQILCSIFRIPIYYEHELDTLVKIYDHLNFSRASVVHFRASRYPMGLTHTPVSKVMTVWIFGELLCTISRVSIYFEPESDIQVICFDHLNFSRASIVHFWTSRYVMGLTHTPESKVMAVWIFRELPFSISTVSIYYAPEWISEWNFMTISITRELPLFIFERLDIWWALHIHPSQKLWPFEYTESFVFNFLRLDILCARIVDPSESSDHLNFSIASMVHFRASQNIMGLSNIHESNVMAIWILWAFVYNFERLDILCTSIGHPSEMLWPFEFLESLRCSFSSVSIYHGPHTYTRVKSYGRLNLSRPYTFNFGRLDILWGWIGHPSETFQPFEFLESFHCWFSSVSIYNGPHTYSRVESYDHLNLPRASMHNFERLNIL